MYKLDQAAKETRHIGEITMSDMVLLDLLQFEGGRILNIISEPHRGLYKIYVEHPEMPECPEGSTPSQVTPLYATTYHDCGHATVKRNELKTKG